jgi:hypothetical protein
MSDERDPAQPGNGASTASKRVRPTKILPTERIQFPKQLDILRAYAAASGPTGKAVTLKAVTDLVKMVESTVSLSNSFFTDTLLITRTGDGILPSQDVVNYLRAYEWNPETAAQKLAPTLRNTWFGQRLVTKLTFQPMSETEAIQDLAQEAAAGKEYEKQIVTLLDYLEAAAVIARDDNGTVRLGSLAKDGGRLDGATRASAATPSPQETRETAPTARAGAGISTSFSAAPTQGVVQFHVSVKVDMNEFKGWNPDRIAAFFGGIAQVLAAKGQIEQEGTET